MKSDSSKLIHIILWFLCINSLYVLSSTARIRCSRPDVIPNGVYRIRKNFIVRVNCRLGFTLVGPRIVECVRGKWYGERPVCAKKGCLQSLTKPENGFIEYKNEQALLFCYDNFIIAGNRVAYCNGTSWDRDIGSCRLRRYETQHECDFETEDICGWAFDINLNYEWKRIMAANVFTTFSTGPRHDHTTKSANGGHYMLMESMGFLQTPANLMSPIYDKELTLKTACCFRFFYFMYGAGVGELYVFVRPVSVSIDEMWADKELYKKFYLKENQNNIWNEAQFKIEELEENFQIIFSVVGGRGHLSDIAIDDVKLLTGKECDESKKTNDDDLVDSDEATERTLFDMQSCESRCFQANGTGILMKDGKLSGLCSCHEECEYEGSCCPDFKVVCLSEIFDRATTYQYTGPEAYDTTFKIDIDDATAPVITTTTAKQSGLVIPSTTMTLKTTPTTTTTTTTTSTTTSTSTTTTSSTRATPTTTTTRATTTLKSTTPITSLKPSTRITTKSTTVKKTTSKTTTTTPKPMPTTLKTTTTKITPAPTRKASTKKTTIINTTKKSYPTVPSTPTTESTSSAKPTTTKISVRQITTNKPLTTDTFEKNSTIISRTTVAVQNKTIWIVYQNETSTFNRPHHGVSVLLYLLVTALVVICCAALLQRYKDSLKTWFFNRKFSKDDNSYLGSTNSIIAKFTQRVKHGYVERRNGSSKLKSRRKSRERNDDKNSLISDDECDDVNVIVLENQAKQ